ncbi:FAD-dependent oxidoreductase [Candidatus Leptofilum sp.]|uniref:FAD-dependent oxidoreductase n=1 Tax=Candidatus Leptofilum sp. TaxID=3241576 RepID=UPI003B58CF25
MSDKNELLPVLIVGAGPVGLSLATALAQQGVATAVYEKEPTLNQEIRASTLHPATLEMFAEWGVAEQVIANGNPVRQLMYWERRTQELIAQFNYESIAADTPFPFRLQCPQHILTRTLKPLLQQSPYATVHMGHELIGFTDHGSHVTAVFQTENGEVAVNGRYLCGADGSHSATRRLLGLAFPGSTYQDRFLLIGTDYNFRQHYPDLGPVNYIFDPKEWVIMLALPDLTRVVFRLRDEEDSDTATSPAALQQRLQNFVVEGQNTQYATRNTPPFNILTTQLYRVHRRVADTFRVGNVLLVGDAAHNNNPMGGMGMNSGIHDAHNLAPKLSSILEGEGDESLLDQYNTERRQVALEDVQSYSEQRFKDMTAKSDAERQQRDAQLRAMAADPALARAYLLKASMLSERI